MQYDNTNRGSLFKNDRKEKETHPDLKGSININGQEFWLSGWSKVTSKGDKMLSLSVTPKEQQAANLTGVCKFKIKFCQLFGGHVIPTHRQT